MRFFFLLSLSIFLRLKKNSSFLIWGFSKAYLYLKDLVLYGGAAGESIYFGWLVAIVLCFTSMCILDPLQEEVRCPTPSLEISVPIVC